MQISWPEQGFLRRWEGKAHELRRVLALGEEDPLDPFRLIEALPGVCALSAAAVRRARPFLERLYQKRHSWWAAAYREDAGPWLILYNPWQSKTRLHPSLMEEVAHIHLNDKPTQVALDADTGLLRRSYGRSKEREAYGVAAAALVPFVGLVRRLARDESDDSLAGHFGVSKDILRYRANTTGARVRARAVARLP